MRAIRRTQNWQRDVRSLAIARGISMAGAEAGYIALLALAWRLTGSASHASLVLLAATVVRVFGAPLSGWIGDRFDRRRVIVGSEIGVAAALCLMAAAQSMPQLLAASMLHAFAASTCGSALDAAVANLVPRSQLTRANATLGMARSTGHMLGPVLGGVVIAASGARAAFLVDAASSIVAALVLLRIRGELGGTAPRTADDGAPGGMLDGMRAVANEPVLRLVAAGYAALCVCFAFVTAAELPLAVSFGADEAGLGAIVSSWCAGSILGAWLARRVHVEQRGAGVLVANALACGVVFAAAGIAPSFAIVVALMAVGGFAMAMGDVVELTIVQQHSADSVRARVMAAFQGLYSAVWGTNLALAGLVVDATSPGTAYVYAGAWCLVAALGFVALARWLRRARVDQDLRIARPRHALETELAESA
jgi:MFS family permease